MLEEVDLAEIAERAVDGYAVAPSRALRRTRGALAVDGEAAALERAVTNLLDNAAKWSPPGRDACR